MVVRDGGVTGSIIVVRVTVRVSVISGVRGVPTPRMDLPRQVPKGIGRLILRCVVRLVWPRPLRIRGVKIPLGYTTLFPLIFVNSSPSAHPKLEWAKLFPH